MNRLLRVAVVMLLPIGPISMPSAAIAQTAPTSQKCMAYVPSGSPDGVPSVIVIPADQTETMATRGYVDHPCSDNPDDFTNWRNQMCYLAEIPDPLIKDQVAQLYNATPSELCDLANAVAQAL